MKIRVQQTNDGKGKYQSFECCGTEKTTNFHINIFGFGESQEEADNDFVENFLEEFEKEFDVKLDKSDIKLINDNK